MANLFLKQYLNLNISFPSENMEADLIVRGGESVCPHPVREVGVLPATVAALVSRVLGEIFYDGQAPPGSHLCLCSKIHKYMRVVGTRFSFFTENLIKR